MDVRFDSDGCVIAGTLTQVREPVAAALVITGIAEALTAANVMTLRYDKRGIGQSGGDYRHAGMTENTGEQIIEWQIGQIEPTIPGFAKAIMRLTGSDFVTSQHKRLDRLRSSSGDVIRMSGGAAGRR